MGIKKIKEIENGQMINFFNLFVFINYKINEIIFFNNFKNKF